MRLFLLAMLAGVGVFSCAGAALDWPQFRGPDGTGASPAKNVPLTWSPTNHLVWEVSLPGRGRSSPVVMGDRVWLTLAVERDVVRKRIGPDDMQSAEHVALEALCLDLRTGEVLWRTRLFEVEHPDPVHWFNSWATPTPVIAGDRLYCDFGTFGTAALEAATGQVLWKTRLPLDHQVGPGSSPVRHENALILVRDGRDAQYVAALELETGKEVWRTARPPLGEVSPNMKKSFVTPLLVQFNGKPLLLSPGAQWVVAYDPATGREYWRARHGTGFSIGSGPVFADGTVFFSTGCMRPQLLAVRADGEGDVTATHVLWKSMRQVPVMSSPVLHEGNLYYVSDEGMASCVDARTGEAHWQERLNQAHLASPLLAEGRVYFFGREGQTTVVRAAPKFEQLAVNSLEGTVIATPALLDGTILLRTDTHLHRIGVPAVRP